MSSDGGTHGGAGVAASALSARWPARTVAGAPPPAPRTERVGDRPLVIEMGAGNSRTVAGLWPPGPSGLRYVATDISAPALQAGRRILGSSVASVQCDAVAWPMRAGVADIVMVLGVLHHLSDWHGALAAACRTVRPGGFLLMHEAVTKPRVLARRRHTGVDDGWVSPHEGDVPAFALRTELERRGIVRAGAVRSRRCDLAWCAT